MHCYSSISENVHVINVRVSHMTKRENLKLTSSIYANAKKAQRIPIVAGNGKAQSRIDTA
jgi:hypothetical protein